MQWLADWVFWFPTVLRPWLAGLIIVTVVGLTYANSFSGPFVFDDILSIRDNTSIRSLAGAWFPPNEHGLTVSGRPLLNVTFALNYAVSGLAVESYHAANVLIHCLCACVLFGVVRRSFFLPRLAGVEGAALGSWLALAVALLWALHPLQTESVTYVVQRAESLVTLFYLLTLWCFIRAIGSAQNKFIARLWLGGALMCCLAGMASKEVMATAPLLIACYDRVFVTESWRALWRERKWFYLGLAATWGLLAGLVIATGNRGGTAGLGTSVSSADYALTQIGAVVHYLRLVVWPHPLVFDYGSSVTTDARDIFFPALILLPLVGGAVWLLLRGRATGYLLCFFFAVLAPTSSFIPVVTQTMNEHRVYLPLAGLVTLFVVLMYRLLGRKSFAVFGLLALGYGGLTFARNLDYREEGTLWEDTVSKRPTNDRAHAALAAIYQREGRLSEAMASLQEAARLKPSSAEHQNNLGNVWMKLGRWEEAALCFEQALKLKPGDAFQLNNLGNARLEQGRVREALGHLEAALHANPDLHEARYNLANILAQNGRFADALPHYEILLRTQPNDAEAHSNYGNVLLALNRAPEGIAALERAHALRPDDAKILNNLGAACAQSGRLSEAVRYFEKASQLNPDFVEARENAERARRALSAH